MTSFACALAATACASGADLTLPSVVSRPNPSRHAGLYAGFGRADLTPPVGVPMGGNGFEGQQAAGYRQRLFARAVALEGGDGQRVALVVADLPHFSMLLHRWTAAEVFARTGIGADRLMISVTHTHSGPANHYEARQLNEQASRYPGLDERLVRFLVDGLARAVEAAVADLRPSVAAWGWREVHDVSLNRSLSPYRANPAATASTAPEAVDDTLRMLRIDQCGPGWTDCRPKGAFSAFAVHATVMPPANPLFDSDVYGVVERRVERAIAAANPALGTGFRSSAFHLLANGAEGDVRPDHGPASRCGARRRFEAGRWSGGPRGSEPAEAWRWLPGDPDDCLRAARAETVTLGTTIADSAISLHAELAAELTRDVPIARAFRTVNLSGHPELCVPRAGVSTVIGGDEARTRLHEWRLLGINLGFDEKGSSARAEPEGCHGTKRQLLEPFGIQGLIVGPLGLPTYAQFAVVRVGDGLIATVPGEVTSFAGETMRRAVEQAGPSGVRLVTLMGLANGHLQYVATEAEYEMQHYEGGSTAYGPRTASVFTAELADLAASLRAGIDVAYAPTIVAGPGPRRSYMPSITQGPDPSSITRRVVSIECTTRELSATWVDVHPGRFRAHLGQVLEIQRESGAGWVRVDWDDSPHVIVRAVRSRGSRGYEWSVSWEPPGGPAPGTYRLFLTDRLGMPEVAGGGVTASCP